MARDRKGNPALRRLIVELEDLSRRNDSGIWRDLAMRLEGPSRNWAEVNVSRIARHARAGDTIAVPGKLLGSGIIDIAVTVGALNVSQKARAKIEKAGGKAIDLLELARDVPSGRNVRIMG